MSKKTKKAMSMLLVVTLIAVIAIGGMLAYLTDRDSEANVFTVGDVSIELQEDFNQGAELTPGAEIEKDVTVKNTGKNDAWVWVTVAVPAGMDGDALKITGTDTAWNWTGPAAETVKIEDKEYNLYTVFHNDALATGATTKSAMTTVSVNSAIDITPDGEWYVVEDGTATKVDWNNKNGNPVIYVSAYAIQTENFADVQAAYDAYNTQWDDNGVEYGTPAAVTEVATEAELEAAITEGGTIVLTSDIAVDADTTMTVAKGKAATLNLNGHTIDGTTTETGKNRNMITVKGDLVVADGTLTTEHTGENMGWGNLSSAISIEGGSVVLDDVIIEHKGGTNMAYGVDVNTTLGETALTIKGETKITSTYTAVRIFNNNKTQTGTVNLESGSVDGASRDIWVQNPSANAVDANGIVNITNSDTYETIVQSESSFYGRIYQFN